jgi:hypothetical protein
MVRVSRLDASITHLKLRMNQFIAHPSCCLTFTPVGAGISAHLNMHGGPARVRMGRVVRPQAHAFSFNFEATPRQVTE